MSSVKRFHLPPAADLVLTDVLYALSDPTRLGIVALLDSGGDQCCSQGSLASVPKSTLAVAPGTTAEAITVLRDTGVITTRIEGTYSINSLRRADLDARFPGLLDAVLHSLPPCPLTNSRSSKDKAPA